MKRFCIFALSVSIVTQIGSANINQYREKILNHESVVAHWTFDGNYEDIVGGHNGERRGNVSFGEGVGGTQGIHFTGESPSDFVLVRAGQPDLQASLDSPFTTESMTVLVWAIRTFEDNWDNIVERNRCWYISPENRDFVCRIYSPANLGGGGTPQIRTSGVCVAGELYFMALTYDYDTAFVSTFLNGELMEEVTFVDGIPPIEGVTTDMNDGGDIAFGTWRNHDPDDQHAGMIDEASYLSVALSPEEIADLYATMMDSTIIQSWHLFD